MVLESLELNLGIYLYTSTYSITQLLNAGRNIGPGKVINNDHVTKLQ